MVRDRIAELVNGLHPAAARRRLGGLGDPADDPRPIAQTVGPRWLAAGMETSRLLTFLADHFTRLRDVAAKDLTAAVPSCPGWTVTDLARHVAEVYLHKAAAMREQRLPTPWPPDLSGEEPIALLDRAYAELLAELDRRSPEDPAWTWHQPDQTVRFWVRRMAQETVIHRVDTELALGGASAPIADDLAVDGIDEVLRIFLGYGTETWRDDFGDQLTDWGDRSVLVTTDGGRWRLAVRPTGVVVTGDDGDGAAATIQGAPAPLLLWLWNRGGQAEVTVGGDQSLVDQLRRLLVMATQ